MEVLKSEEFSPLRFVVIGLQATTCLALAFLFFGIILAIFWKNVLIQTILQGLSRILPVNDLFNLKKYQKVCIAPKIDAEHCSICYCDINKEVISNCGHVFCGDCLIKFWHSKKKEKISCPLCRSDVNMLIANFATNEMSIKDNETKNIVDNITHYNISCSNCPSTILGLVLGSPSSLKIFLESLPSRQGFTSVFKLVLAFLYVLAMLIYFISPAEIVPEYETMFGWVDESASFIYLFLYVVVLFVMVS